MKAGECLTRLTDRRAVGLEKTSGVHLVQLCPSRVTKSTLPRTLSGQAVNIFKHGDFTTSQDNLFQGSVTVTVKSFLVFKQNSVCSSSCLLPLVLSPGNGEKSLALSSLRSPFRYFYTLISSLSLFFSRLNSPNSLLMRDAPVSSSS